MDELAKIDLLRKRLGITYREAQEALLQTEGDVVQALINLEECCHKSDDNFKQKGQELIAYIKEMIKKGNVTKIRLKKQEQTVWELSVTVGVIGVGGMLLSPLLTLLGVVGTVAALVADYRLEIVRADGRVERHDLKFLEKENRNNKKN